MAKSKRPTAAKTPQQTTEELFVKAQQQTELTHKRELQKLHSKLIHSEALRGHLEEELAELKTVADWASEVPKPTPVAIKRVVHKVHGSATAILVLSDWHVEETVDPSTVNNLNKFNLEIASQRIKRTFEKAVVLIDAERKMSNIKDIVCAILGDIITGYIHEELMEDNSLSPTEACLFAEDHITGGIDFLLKESGCKSITIPTALGNHGRTTAKLRIGTHHKNSFEWLMYRHLEKCYRNDPRVTWKVENSYHNWLTVQGKDIRFHHGTPIKYKGGVAGPSVPIRRKIAQWNSAKVAWWDIFGHLHIYEPGDRYLANPSLIGYGAFSEFVGGYTPPMQTLMIVDKNWSIPVSVKPIFCEAEDIQITEDD